MNAPKIVEIRPHFPLGDHANFPVEFGHNSRNFPGQNPQGRCGRVRRLQSGHLNAANFGTGTFRRFGKYPRPAPGRFYAAPRIKISYPMKLYRINLNSKFSIIRTVGCVGVRRIFMDALWKFFEFRRSKLRYANRFFCVCVYNFCTMFVFIFIKLHDHDFIV